MADGVEEGSGTGVDVKPSYKLYGAYIVRHPPEVLPDIYQLGRYLPPTRQNAGRGPYREPRHLTLQSEYGRRAASAGRYEFLFPNHGHSFAPDLGTGERWEAHQYFKTYKRAYLDFSKPFQRYLTHGDEADESAPLGNFSDDHGSITKRRLTPRERVERDLVRATAMARAGIISANSLERYWLADAEDSLRIANRGRYRKGRDEKNSFRDELIDGVWSRGKAAMYARTGFLPPPEKSTRSDEILANRDRIIAGNGLYTVGAITAEQYDRYYMPDERYDVKTHSWRRCYPGDDEPLPARVESAPSKPQPELESKPAEPEPEPQPEPEKEADGNGNGKEKKTVAFNEENNDIRIIEEAPVE